MSKVKLTKMQKDIIDAYYHEFGVSGCVSYYSINGYLMVALEVVKNTSPYTRHLEEAVREYLLKKYESEVYHYIDNYEEEIKGEVLL